MIHSYIELCHVSFSYTQEIKILRDISYRFETGKVYAIQGPSGCGKTTLLALLGGLDVPQQGEIVVDGENIQSKGLAYHRRNNTSFVFQNKNSIEYMTSIENVQLTTSRTAALLLLEKVGLDQDLCTRGVLNLSGGQQQRVAIARALGANSSVLLADEPTGSLDESTARGIANILLDSAHVENKCVIIATHSSELAGDVDIRLSLRHGELARI